MPRYIDADALIERILKLKVVTDNMYGMGIARGIERAETAIQMQPTADVVPASEIAKEFTCFVGDPHKVEHCPYLEEIENAKAEVAREIFEEIENISSDFPLYGNTNTAILSESDFAELKKKYTEGDKEHGT